MSLLVFLIAVVLAAGAAWVAFVLQQLSGLPVLLGLIVGTAAWAAWDSSKLRFSKYKGGNSPVVVFFGVLALWILVLPWYIAKRRDVKRGSVPLLGDKPTGNAATP